MDFQVLLNVVLIGATAALTVSLGGALRRLDAAEQRAKLLAEHVAELGHSTSVIALALQTDRQLHIERSKAVHEYMDSTMRFMEQTAAAVKTLLENSDAH